MNEQNSISTLDPSAKKSAADSTSTLAPTMLPATEPDSWLAWSITVGPTFLVLVLLGGFAYLGHQTGWTMPKFANMFGARKAAEDDWCEKHSVPESICVECDKSLLPLPKSTWCAVHGVHNCPFERPEIAQLHTTPIVAKEDRERAKRAFELKDRKKNSEKCSQHQRRIQFASDDIVKKMGIGVDPVERKPIFETISASGEIMPAQPLVASVSAPVAGRVFLITKKGVTRTRVKRGEVLALLDAVEVGKAKAELLQAYAQTDLRKKTVDLLGPLDRQGVVTQSRVMEADLALRESRIRLFGALQALSNMGLPIQVEEGKESVEQLASRIHFFGIPEEIALGFDAKSTTANLMPVIASRDGTVTAAKVTQGETADAGKPLFVISDTSQMWLMLKVRIEDVQYLRLGQTVKFWPDGYSKKVGKKRVTFVEGELVWKSTDVDEKTRTVHYRAELLNPDGSLLANTYGTGQIVVRAEARTGPKDAAEKDAIVVPTEAVHWEGDCHIVFVRDKNYLDPNIGLKVFHVRTVRLGVIDGPYTEILAGVLPGEVVATSNSATLRAELLKNNLGAG